jgi:hypothetical protein
MIRLLRGALSVWLVMMAAVAVAYVIGRAQPAPSAITNLHLDDCPLPCWLGIVPHVTSMDEARTTLRRVFDTGADTYLTEDRAANGFIVWNRDRQRLMTIEFPLSVNTVNLLRININRNYPTLGDIYGHLPHIQWVSTGGNWGIPFAGWSMQGVELSRTCRGRSIRMTALIVVLMLGGDTTSAIAEYAQPWRGLGCYR